MTAQRTQLVMAQAFQRGLSWGMRGIFRGNLCVDHSEEGVVEIIQNLIDLALEGNLTEELLRQDVGIVVGYAIAHPEEFIKGSRSSRSFLRSKNATGGADSERQLASIKKVERSLVDPFTEQREVVIKGTIVERTHHVLDRCSSILHHR